MSSYTYLKIDTLEYPLYQGDIRLKHPEIGNEFILPEGYVEVEPVDLPIKNENQDYIRLAPEKIDGKYFQRIGVRDLTENEIQERKKLMEQFMPKTNTDTTLSGTPPDVID